MDIVRKETTNSRKWGRVISTPAVLFGPGVWAVLSQHVEPGSKLHQYAFYALWLMYAEKNYDVGKRELLVVKLDFEEWRH